MSDTPQAEGWWQASDGKWYAPQPPPPPKTGQRIGAITGLLVVAICIGALFGLRAWGRHDSDQAEVGICESINGVGGEFAMDCPRNNSWIYWAVGSGALIVIGGVGLIVVRAKP